jgi:hypothetical protein
MKVKELFKERRTNDVNVDNVCSCGYKVLCNDAAGGGGEVLSYI